MLLDVYLYEKYVNDGSEDCVAVGVKKRWTTEKNRKEKKALEEMIGWTDLGRGRVI